MSKWHGFCEKCEQSCSFQWLPPNIIEQCQNCYFYGKGGIFDHYEVIA